MYTPTRAHSTTCRRTRQDEYQEELKRFLELDRLMNAGFSASTRSFLRTHLHRAHETAAWRGSSYHTIRAADAELPLATVPPRMKLAVSVESCRIIRQRQERLPCPFARIHARARSANVACCSPANRNTSVRASVELVGSQKSKRRRGVCMAFSSRPSRALSNAPRSRIVFFLPTNVDQRMQTTYTEVVYGLRSLSLLSLRQETWNQ
uniref:Uncharacterized protein n=1 Tax=Mycena chlorophos TaxID=658473 RepID=A0ABQ0KWV6_MYCCL|nr:predicted protein [Mycena chlorophos]